MKFNNLLNAFLDKITLILPEELEFYPGYKTWGKKKTFEFCSRDKIFRGGGHQDGSCSAIKPDKMK